MVSQGVGGWLEGSQGVGGSVEGSQGVGGSAEVGSQGVGGSAEAGSSGVTDVEKVSENMCTKVCTSCLPQQMYAQNSGT